MISRVKVESEKASLRAMTNLTTINLKTNQKREQRIVLNFAFVKENEQWKVWRSVAAEEDLAEALVKAKTESERSELLAEEKELVALGLVRALRNKADRFYGRGEPAQSLMTYKLAQSIAEQIGDRYEIGRTLLFIGHVHRLMGNNAQAMEHFQKCLAINEALDEKVEIGSTLIGIGLIHDSQGNYTQALEAYRKSLTIFEPLNNKSAIATVLQGSSKVA